MTALKGTTVGVRLTEEVRQAMDYYRHQGLFPMSRSEFIRAALQLLLSDQALVYGPVPGQGPQTAYRPSPPSGGDPASSTQEELV